MSGMFDDFKEQVRSQANIVEIISEYVPLKKRGCVFLHHLFRAHLREE